MPMPVFGGLVVITKFSCVLFTGANLQHFIPSRQRVLLKNSDAQYKGVSVDQCASNCLGEVTFDCQSFDYCFDTGTCVLSQTHPDKNPKLVATPQMCDLYASTFNFAFNKSSSTRN